MAAATFSTAKCALFPLTDARGGGSLLTTFLWVAAWLGGRAGLGSRGREGRGGCGGPRVRVSWAWAAAVLRGPTPEAGWTPDSGGPLRGLSDRE